MRLYVYVSESIKLSDLVPITESSKVRNTANGITGIFSYSYGHYLQVIEGEDAEVGKLIRDIHQDKRHQNICEIVDIEVDERFFSGWTVNLVPLLKRNDSFLEFTKFIESNLRFLSRKQKRLFNIFYKLSEKRGSKSKQDSFTTPAPLVYSIKEWPNFDVIEPTSCLMSLCGLIMNNPMQFKELNKRHFSSTEHELRLMLNDLNKGGYLEVSMSQRAIRSDTTKTNKEKKSHFQTWRKDFQIATRRPQLA